MRKRQGFALLWAVSAVSIVFLLGGTAFFMLRAALRSEQAMEIEADEAFLVQEVMETIKYNSPCRARSLFLPETWRGTDGSTIFQ